MAKSTRLDFKERKELERRSGLDRLREYIPDKDYNDALVQYAAAGIPEDAEMSPAREAMLERSIAVMGYLRDNGYDFNVGMDKNQGQLKLKIADTKIEMRVLDTDANAQYAANRVYDNGVTYRVTHAPKNVTIDDRPVASSPRGSIDLMRYALGEDVKRIDRSGPTPKLMNEYAGSPSTSMGVKAADTYFTGSEHKYRTPYVHGKAYTGINAKGEAYSGFDDVYFYAESESRFANTVRFDGDEALKNAENFIEDSRTAAIGNFTEALKLDALDKLAQSKVNNEFDGMPEFSADSKLVVDMQQAYYNERVNIYKNTPEDSRTDALYVHDEDFKKSVSDIFGSVQNRSINPINVSAYMDVTKGSLTNENNLLAALKTVDREKGEPYELIGDGFAENGFKDKMIAYDSAPVYDKNGNQIYPRNINPASEDFDKLPEFWQNIGRAVNSGLGETGVSVSAIELDRNGIIHYEGEQRVGADSRAVNSKIVGNIGQVFEPDMSDTLEDGSPNLKKGLIKTQYNSGDNYYIAPGYTAYVVPPKGADDNRSYEERTRLRGYEQTMAQKIKSTLRHDIIANNNYDNTSGLNGVYHRIYGDKLPLDFEEQMTQEGKDKGSMRALIETSLRRVRYDNCYKEGTSMLARANAESKTHRDGRGYDLYLDNVKSVMAIMNAETSKNIFDPYLTGTGTNQGAVRYLVSDAEVAPDGSIIKGKSEKAPIMEHEDFKYAEYNPPDRLIMAAMNSINQSSTARGRDVNANGDKIEPIGVGMAHMSLGGYTQDDAFVVSKAFAEQNMIRGKDGEMRPLQIGDKICDHSGNKGVLSFIADPDMDMSYFKPEILHEGMSEKEYRQAIKNNDRKELQAKVVQIFKDNPTLDVIGAPYTAPSRFNGGTARELIDSQNKAHEANMPTSLKINGKTVDGAIGYASITVTDMGVDEKTHLYEDEGGRRSSGQLIWALSEAGANELINEMYQFNTESSVKLREMMIPLGYDISQDGKFRRGYESHITGVDENGDNIKESRNEFSVKEAHSAYRAKDGKLHNNNFKAAFDREMSDDGGFMKMPFPIKLASGEMTPEKLDENGKGTGEYMLPVLAGKYRSSRETVDGKLMSHELTGNYKDIYIKAGAYLTAKEKCELAQQTGNNTEMLAQKKKMEEAAAGAQSGYDKIADKIGERYFTGKHNIFKDEIMRKQQSNTATAVITPDPTLDMDEIAMSATMANAIGLDINDPDPRTVVWRDPVLSGGGMRYSRVNIIENRPGYPGYDARNPMSNLVGIAMNPSAASSFEGDFDGDSVGLYTPQGRAAKNCAMRTLSYEAQLLNREVGNRGEHSLYVQDGLDVAAGIYADTQRGGKAAELFESAKNLANQADAQNDKHVDAKSMNHKALETLNDAMHEAHKSAFGEDVICYKNPEEHFKSLIHMTQSGAKGSPSKLTDGYGKYFGCKAEIDENYNLVKFEDTKKPYATVEDREASLSATHAKAVLTGVAGKFSQHAAMMAKNSENSFSNAATANALTHPVTQSVMQLKHDGPDEIMHKIDMIQNVLPALWAGDKIERSVDDNGKPSWAVTTEVKDRNKAEPVPASPEEWKKMFVDFYTDKHGLNVAPPNPEYVAKMAEIMTVRENGKEIVRGFDKKTKAIMPMEKPLDRLAYECNLETLDYYAERRANLFEGSVNSCIAPKVVKDNIAETQKAAVDASYKPSYKPLAAKDTQVTNNLDTPSVDAVHEALKIDAAENIHIKTDRLEADSSEINNTTAPEIKKAEAAKPKSYHEMTSEEQLAVVKSAANKALDGGKQSYTPAETEFRTQFVKEQQLVNSMGDKKARNEFIAANPDMTSEYRKYLAAVAECRNERKAMQEPSYKSLSAEEKMQVAASVASKAYSGDKDYTKLETEFRAQLKEQHDTIKAFGSDKSAINSFTAQNPGCFNEYKLYVNAYHKCKSEHEQSQTESQPQQAEDKKPAVNANTPRRTANFAGTITDPSVPKPAVVSDDKTKAMGE